MHTHCFVNQYHLVNSINHKRKENLVGFICLRLVLRSWGFGLEDGIEDGIEDGLKGKF